MEVFLDKIQKTHKSKNYHKRGLHTFINPFSYLKIRKKGLLDKFDFIYIDGFLLVSILRSIGITISRNSFDMTSLAKKVFINAVEKKKTVYFIGSTQKSILKFVKVVRANFPGMDIMENRCGFFSDLKDREETIQGIVEAKPDVVIVGMGTPLQEFFLIDLSNAGWKGSGYTCGGFIHQTTDRLQYYPNCVDKYNLRWLYRIYDEPKLAKRYMIYYPISVILFISDIFALKAKKIFQK